MRKKYYLLLFIFIFLCLPNFVKAEEVHSNEYVKYSDLLEFKNKESDYYNSEQWNSTCELTKVDDNYLYLICMNYRKNNVNLLKFDYNGKKIFKKSITNSQEVFVQDDYIYSLDDFKEKDDGTKESTLQKFDYNGDLLNKTSISSLKNPWSIDFFISNSEIYLLLGGRNVESYVIIDKNFNAQTFEVPDDININFDFSYNFWLKTSNIKAYEDSKYFYYSNVKFDRITHEVSLITDNDDYDYFKAYKSSQNNEYTYSVMTKDILEKAIQKNSENIETVNNFITDEFIAGIVVLDKNEKIINILPEYSMGIECNEFYCFLSSYEAGYKDNGLVGEGTIDIYNLNLEKKLTSIKINGNFSDTIIFKKYKNYIFTNEHKFFSSYAWNYELKKYEPFIYEATEKVYMRKTFNLKNFLGSSFDLAKIEIENPDIAKIEGDYIKPLKVGSTSIKIYNNYKFYNIQFDVLDENQEIVENTDINPLTKTYLTYISMLILFIIMLIILLYLKKHRKLNKNGFDNL